MKENWVKIEDLFREKGIDFERQDWLYFCLIEGRNFYYSPQTGKWRIKGKGIWLCSTSPENFIAMAKVYVVPESKPHATKFNQKKTRSLPNRKTKSTSTQENTKSNDARSRGLTQQQNRSSSQIGKPKIKTQTIEVPLSIAKEVQLFVNLLLTGEIDSVSDLFKKAGLSLSHNLETLWNKVVNEIYPPTTKSILRQKSQLLSFEDNKAIVQINAPPLKRILQGKIPNVEAAFYEVLGKRVTVKLVVKEDDSDPSSRATPMLLRRMIPKVENATNPTNLHYS